MKKKNPSRIGLLVNNFFYPYGAKLVLCSLICIVNEHKIKVSLYGEKKFTSRRIDIRKMMKKSESILFFFFFSHGYYGFRKQTDGAVVTSYLTSMCN